MASYVLSLESISKSMKIVSNMLTPMYLSMIRVREKYIWLISTILMVMEQSMKLDNSTIHITNKITPINNKEISMARMIPTLHPKVPSAMPKEPPIK